MKIFLMILLFILFLPLPIVVSFYFSLENYYLKLYKFTILKKKEKSSQIKEVKDEKGPKEYKVKKKKNKKRKWAIKFNPKKILKLINKNKFKPHLNINGSLNYSLNDPSNTAISYGVFSALLPIIKNIINIVFKTNKFKLPLQPNLNKGFFIQIEIKSIFFISLAQIIYMLILILRGITFKKEENINGK